jgi:hypothetical protein
MRGGAVATHQSFSSLASGAPGDRGRAIARLRSLLWMVLVGARIEEDDSRRFVAGTSFSLRLRTRVIIRDACRASRPTALLPAVEAAANIPSVDDISSSSQMSLPGPPSADSSSTAEVP